MAINNPQKNYKKNRTKKLYLRFIVSLFLIGMFSAIFYLLFNINTILNLNNKENSNSISSSNIENTNNNQDKETTNKQEKENSLVHSELNKQDIAFNGLVYEYPKLPSEQIYHGYSAQMLSLSTSYDVTTDYFADAIFIGDSLMDGFPVYLKDYLPATTRYYTKKSMGPMAFVMEGATWILSRYNSVPTAPLADIASVPANKVYINTGINDLNNGRTDDVILKYYRELIRAVKQIHPTAIIYIQSITPVTKQTATEKAFAYSLERIHLLNDQLAVLAISEGCVYLDLHEVLTDAEGYLKQEIASETDGIHMRNNQGYFIWLDYLQKHTVFSPTNPYM